MKPSKVFIRVFPNSAELSRAAADLFASSAREAASERGRFTCALSGGGTPRAMYAILAKPPYRETLPWEEMLFFWGDERCVPPDDPESSYNQAREILLAHVPVSEKNIFRIKGELGPQAAAEDYARQLKSAASSAPPFKSVPDSVSPLDSVPDSVSPFDSVPDSASPLDSVPDSASPLDSVPNSASLLKSVVNSASPLKSVVSSVVSSASDWPRFDFALMGLGADGHTASLFPGLPGAFQQGSEETHGAATVAVTAHYQDRPANRVSLTPDVFNSARKVVFLVAGVEKAQALASTLKGKRDPLKLPAQSIQPADGRVIWLVDEAAASQLPAQLEGIPIYR